MPIFDVRFQEPAQRLIWRAMAGARLPHAYIFHGPPGVGKRMLADRLANLLLCPKPREVVPPEWAGRAFDGIRCVDACGRCPDCHTATAGTHPDLHPIYRDLKAYHPDSQVRQRKGIELSIDVVRHFLLEPAGRRPLQGRAKVFIVEEAERLSEEAQNAMLKTLEEPPPTTFIILLTRSLDGLLPTTRSRCQPVPFRALPAAFVESRLRELRPGLPPEGAAYLARFSQGRLGLAAQYAEDGLHEMKRAIGESLATLSPHSAGAFAGKLAEQAAQYGKLAAARETEASDTEMNRVGLRAFLAVIAAFYADALRRQCGSEGSLINVDQPRVIDALAGRHSRRGLTQAIRESATAGFHIEDNANVQLTLESLAVRLTRCG